MRSMSTENFSLLVILFFLVIAAESAPQRFQHLMISGHGFGDLPPDVREFIETDEFLPRRRFGSPLLGGNMNNLGPIFNRNEEDNFFRNSLDTIRSHAWGGLKGHPIFSRFPIFTRDEQGENDGEGGTQNKINRFVDNVFNPFREEADHEHADGEPTEDDDHDHDHEDHYHGHDKVEPFHGGFFFDTPFFNVRQVSKTFHQMEKSLEHVFRQAMDEATHLSGTYANTTEEKVDINGRKYIIQKSITKGKDNNNSIYIEALSSVPKSKGKVPKTDEEVPKKNEEVPKKDEEVPKKDEEVPKKDEEVPKNDEEVPKKDEEVPKKDEEMPKMDKKGEQDIDVKEADELKKIY